MQDIVAACGAVSSDVTKSPDCLLPNVGLVAAEQLDENRNRARLDNDLCLLCRARGNVGERPCGLKLHQCVWGAEELDKSADNARLDNSLNRRVALFGKEFSEFCGRLDLLVDLLGENSLYHLRKLFVELVGGSA